jgi:hypothetical protein
MLLLVVPKFCDVPNSVFLFSWVNFVMYPILFFVFLGQFCDVPNFVFCSFPVNFVMYPILFCVFLGQFCDVPKVAIIHVYEDLDRFGYKLNMKVIFFKHQVYGFGYLLEP